MCLVVFSVVADVITRILVKKSGGRLAMDIAVDEQNLKEAEERKKKAEDQEKSKNLTENK